MIDNAAISSPGLAMPNLTVVGRNIRQRDQIDRKKYFFIAKRIFDVAFAAVFIIAILSWLTLIVAAIIKLTSKGPVFFLQKRIGRGGRSFTCYKFRTMVVNAEADTRQASENDARITWFGWLLRKSNIDEFPQFFNVLSGSMSVVGPRPHMYADCRNFSSVLPRYKFRNLVKPGLTGLAQVKGYHGPTTTRNSILMRYHWDNYYVRNLGFALDCKIFYLTIIQRIPAMGTYLSEKTQPARQHFGDDVTA